MNFNFEPITEYLEALDYPEERIEEYIELLKLNSRGLPPITPGYGNDGNYTEYFEMRSALISSGLLGEYKEFIKKEKRDLRIRKRDLKRVRKEKKELFRSGFKALSKTFVENGENIKAHIIKIIVEPTLRSYLYPNKRT